jgi:cytochrome c oxidase subunit IV
MSKKQKSIMIILTLVTLLGVLAALSFLPDTIPLHFGVTGAGKYCLLIFVHGPAILYWPICRKMK